MRIMAVSYMLPPMLYPQAIQIGRLLDAQLHELITVSGLPRGMGAFPRGALARAERMEIDHQNIAPSLLHRIGMRVVPFYARSPDEFTRWARQAATAAGDWLQRNPAGVDVVATFGEPMSDHLVGLALKRRFGRPWLAHFSDPWSDNPFRKGQPLANWRNRRLEAAVIHAADIVVFTSDETLRMVMGKYPAYMAAKARVLPHSYAAAEYGNGSASTARAGAVVRYLGNFYGHRTPFPLFRALARLAATSPDALRGVRIELVGGLPRWMRWHPDLKRLPPGMLEIRASVPYAQSLALMRDADLLLVIDAPAKSSVFLPSKLVDYLGSGRPILGIVPPGASRELIGRVGGWTADPSDGAAVEATLLEALTAVAAAGNTRPMQPWGDETVRAAYTIERVAADFDAILRETVAA